MCADLLRDSLTRLVLDSRQDFEPVDLKLIESELGRQAHRLGRHTSASGVSSHPIAQVGELVNAVDKIDAHTSKEVTVCPRVNDEAVVFARIPFRFAAGKEFGVVPCGLGSRNTLRLEGKLPLYGHEISDTINVWEAGLDRFCKMEKPEFLGRDSLEKAKAAGVKRTLVGLEMTERGIARDGYKVQDESGSEIGYVTSGSPSPFLKKNIALAYVPVEHAAVDTKVKVEVRGQGVGAVVVPTPFYKRPKK